MNRTPTQLTVQTLAAWAVLAVGIWGTAYLLLAVAVLAAKYLR